MIEIITHCYCPPGVHTYSEHLKWQYASLFHYSQGVSVKWSVCYSPIDSFTCEQLDTIEQNQLSNVKINRVPLPFDMLFRRAIGRNICALASTASTVWFTDVDYLFGEGCLRYLVENPPQCLTMPETVNISTDHATGDNMIAMGICLDVPLIDASLFAPRKQKICIGGVQIVPGDLARKIGYLNGTKHVKPVDPKAGFRSCRCDKWFRRQNGLKAIAVDIPNVFRIRHSQDGRDFDAKGENKGKAVW